MAAEAPGDEEGAASYYAVLNVPRDATTEEIKRAYRQLASVFHPDKHTDDALRAQAQEAFSRLQEAHEVLSDPEKRDVYDAYGREGLTSGLELGSKLQSTEERRAAWKAFLDERERKRQDAAGNHRGSYVCRLDATAAARGEAKAPAMRMVMASNAVDVPLDFGGADGGVVTLQGQALLRAHPRLAGGMLGSGSVLAGYRRALGDNHSIDASAQVGLQSLLTFTSTRQVDHYTQAALAATYGWEQGLGLQVISTRQLWRTTTGEFRWIVGPQPGGVALGAAHRGRRWGATARLELSGGAGSVLLKGSWDASPSTQLRGSLRLSPMGPDVEVGAEHRFNSATAAYVGTQVSLRGGVLLRLRARRSKQTFEFPVLLSTDAREWRLLAASALLPPLASLAVHKLVVAPLVSWRRAAGAAAARAEHAGALAEAHGKAAREAALLAPVARRRAAAEAAVDGLIILEAVYGDLDAWRAAAAAGGGEAAAVSPAGALWPPAPRREEGQQQAGGAVAESSSGAGGGGGGDAAGASSSAPGERQPGAAAAAAAAAGPSSGGGGEDPLPPPWLDVSAALQYLVAGGGLELHPGVSKRGLMGFADVVAGDGERRLYVAYYFGGALLQKEVGDADMLKLPAAGAPVADAAAAARLRGRLAALVAAVGGGKGGGG
ncbi:MAG: molecular chaperone [Monoraphidium minutum]|nr:MAG: molecular chaperone [Monoraphidium minutum]